MTPLEPQPVPEQSRCPDCGAAPTEESRSEHRLRTLGYLHDDRPLECADCGTTWDVGVPIGAFDGGADLHCDSCKWDQAEPTRMLVHRVEVGAGRIRLHLKCPRCYHYRTAERETGPSSVALVGYPAITGSTDGADPYGYPADDS